MKTFTALVFITLFGFSTQSWAAPGSAGLNMGIDFSKASNLSAMFISVHYCTDGACNNAGTSCQIGVDRNHLESYNHVFLYPPASGNSNCNLTYVPKAVRIDNVLYQTREFAKGSSNLNCKIVLRDNVGFNGALTINHYPQNASEPLEVSCLGG